MNKIGFNHFRRFLQFEAIEYEGITFLVGRNNAGKSTIVKALLLINEYFKSGDISKFSFGNNVLEDANIVTYGRAKNKFAKKNFIVFEYQILNYHIELTVSGVDDQTFGYVEILLVIDAENNLNFFFDIPGKTISISRANLLSPEFDESLENNLILLENEIREAKENLEHSALKKSSKEYIQMVQELNSLESKRNQLMGSRSAGVKTNTYSYTADFDINSTLKEIVDLSILTGLVTYKQEFNEIQKGKKATKNFNNYQGIKNDEKALTNSFSKFYDLITVQSSFVYLGASSAKQSALFSIRDTSNALAQSIHEYYQLKVTPGEPAHEFIEKWMKEFEVGDSFKIEIYAGEAYGVNIQSNNIEIPLADKGMGSIQAMLLLFRLGSIIHKTIDTDDILTIIIEEPELNLHPALQSKLADVFLDVYEKCNHDFIIETHSEYILRRSQVLVAEKEYEVAPNHNPFVVYYFPKDLDQKPYRMKYQEDGTFLKNFGEGFFDAGAKSTLELLKLKRQRNN